jgi:ureidoglycolate dehydrogenase (NAD+)
MSKRIDPAKLTEYCAEILIKAGLDKDDAATVADVLVTTDTWGTFSHGTIALSGYVRCLGAGGMDPNARPEIVEEGDSWAIVDAQSGMGMPACCKAMKLAVEKARTKTIAWVGVRNSNHFGAAGYYANLAAREQMIGIAMSAADPNMTIPGSRGHTIGNNPLAYAVPVGDENPILLDIALSAVAWGKIMALKKQGKEIPPNWITDATGLPTQNLEGWPATGSMMPMAGHKGYGLAILVEALASLLTGAGMLDEMTSWVATPEKPAHLGQAFVVINIGAMLPIASFGLRAKQFATQIRESPKAAGSERVYLPGEIEWEHRAESLRYGIPLPELTLASLSAVGKDLGVDHQFLTS